MKAGLVGCAILMASNATAETAKYGIAQSLGVFAISETQQDSADAEKQTTQEFVTSPQDLELAIGMAEWTLYLYPTDAQGGVGIGYGVTDSIEVGLGLGYSWKREGEAKTIARSYAVCAKQAYEFTGFALETSLELGWSMLTNATGTEDVDSRTEERSLSAGLAAYFPLTEDVEYVTGMSFSGLSGRADDNSYRNRSMEVVIAGVQVSIEN